MTKEHQLRRILDGGIVAVVRSPDSQQLVEVARALADGGVTTVEITMTVPDALDVVRAVRRALGDRLLLGAGTILDPETARAALLAGAEYLVAPKTGAARHFARIGGLAKRWAGSVAEFRRRQKK